MEKWTALGWLLPLSFMFQIVATSTEEDSVLVGSYYANQWTGAIGIATLNILCSFESFGQAVLGSASPVLLDHLDLARQMERKISILRAAAGGNADAIHLGHCTNLCD